MVLVLPIKRKWFDMIKSGEKKEEYREIKPYYDNRIGNAVTGMSFKHCHPDWIKQLENNKEFDVILMNLQAYGVLVLLEKELEDQSGELFQIKNIIF